MGLGAARRAWIWALSAVDPANDSQQIIEAAKAYAAYCKRESIEARFIPMPARWLADERWNDKLPEPPRISGDANLRARASTISKGLSYLIRGSLTARELKEMAAAGLISQEQATAEAEKL